MQAVAGRPRSARTTVTATSNMNTVNDLVLSQEDAPPSHRTTRHRPIRLL